MTLAAGSRLGPYEILAPIGAGGMGEVYKAKDTRLERTVAVKVLPAHLSDSPSLRQRFEREAKTISQLSHPHICAIYDVGRENEVEYLVMEYLEGETLADRVVRGALPFEQTLRFGIEISGALDRAHRAGIVHRDLKPGNVMVTRSGIKLLDFGLAVQRPLDAAGREQTAAARDPMARNSPTALPTVGAPLTQEGTILGTFQYMAPEQLEAKEADARTDIFALGCVLYEMATAKKAFSGASQASLISAIMSSDPALVSSSQPTAPPAFDRIVRTCLAKDPEDRWQSAADISKELRWIAGASGSEPDAVPVRAGRKSRRAAAGWITAAILGLTALALASRLWTRHDAAPISLHASILPPPGTELVATEIFAGPVEVSPDGTRLVFTAHRGEEPNLLWIQPLTEPGPAHPLAGTEGAERPFWSPDGRSIGFFAKRFLRKIDAGGGPVFRLAPVTEGRGGTWNRDGVILFTPSARGPIYRVPAGGGEVARETTLGPKDVTHRYARFLPDGRHYLYLARRGAIGSPQTPSGILVGTLGSSKTTPLVEVSSNVLYASGHLLYVREGALVAQAFDPDRLKLSGDPITIASGIRMDERFSRGVFSASENGVLVYQTGKGHTLSALRWLDRKGSVLSTVGEPAQFFDGGDPNISPDGRRATTALIDVRTGAADVWLVDLETGSRSRFTAGPGDKYFSAWSPDGRRIAHNMRNPNGGGYDIFLKSVGGSGAEERILADVSEWEVPTAFSPDGKFLLVQKRKEDRDDLFSLSLGPERTLRPLVATPALETMGQFSPNGKYVAYVSDESGREEVYVTPFPGAGRIWQVSQNGGTEPRWRRDGKEMFFFTPENRLVAVDVAAEGDSFEVGDYHPLFQARLMGVGFRYDVSADGQRFLVNVGIPDEISPISIVTSWTSQLGAKK